jgi:hypothetical protein
MDVPALLILDAHIGLQTPKYDKIPIFENFQNFVLSWHVTNQNDQTKNLHYLLTYLSTPNPDPVVLVGLNQRVRMKIFKVFSHMVEKFF